MNQGIIWDLDGVIVDSAPFHFEAWREFAAVKGAVYTEEDFRKTFGMRNEDILLYIFDEKLEQGVLETWSDEKEGRFRDLIRGSVEPLPGVMTLVRALDMGGYQQAIASSTPLENIQAMMDAARGLPAGTGHDHPWPKGTSDGVGDMLREHASILLNS